jgi:hypothetical protein
MPILSVSVFSQQPLLVHIVFGVIIIITVTVSVTILVAVGISMALSSSKSRKFIA